MELCFKIEGGDFNSAGNASSEVKKILKQLNIDPFISRRTVVALYEGEVNIVAHAWSGLMKVSIDAEKIFVCFEDSGPGIPDINKAMEEGFSTASPAVREMGFGAGMGLPNIKKNVDILNITSRTGEGTRVEMTIFIKPL